VATPTVVTLPLGPATVNITGVRAGDRNKFTVTLLDGTNPVDLTGLEVTAQARLVATDAMVAMHAVCEVTDMAAAVITVAWPGEAVRILLAGNPTWTGVWDLQAKAPDEDPQTIAAGTLQAVMDVTRP
jgi:hypothetical protein